MIRRAFLGRVIGTVVATGCNWIGRKPGPEPMSPIRAVVYIGDERLVAPDIARVRETKRFWEIGLQTVELGQPIMMLLQSTIQFIGADGEIVASGRIHGYGDHGGSRIGILASLPRDETFALDLIKQLGDEVQWI